MVALSSSRAIPWINMQQQGQGSRGDRLGQDDDEVRAAIRFALVTTVAGVAFLVVAALWVGGCDQPSAVDTTACGAPERTLLAVGAPAILAGGGLWAFVRTYRVWRSYGVWWGWHGAGWFLLGLMVLSVGIGGPSIIGPGRGS
jgi:hypothetical protein